MNLKRHEKDAPDVNITPLIDVVFLLLIFFMVSTTFKKETTISVDLPEAAAKPLTDKIVTSMEVIITRDGQYFIDIKRKNAKGKMVTKKHKVLKKRLKTLMLALKKLSRGNNKLRIYIRADAKSPHGSFVRVMDALSKLGFKKVSIITAPPGKE